MLDIVKWQKNSEKPNFFYILIIFAPKFYEVICKKREGKCDYKTVSVILGHSNISTTLNLYVHPNLEQKKKCINQMNRYLK